MKFKSRPDGKINLMDIEYGELFRFVARDLRTSYEVYMKVHNIDGMNDGVVCVIDGEVVPPSEYDFLECVERIQGEFVEC